MNKLELIKNLKEEGQIRKRIGGANSSVRNQELIS